MDSLSSSRALSSEYSANNLNSIEESMRGATQAGTDYKSIIDQGTKDKLDFQTTLSNISTPYQIKFAGDGAAPAIELGTGGAAISKSLKFVKDAKEAQQTANEALKVGKGVIGSAKDISSTTRALTMGGGALIEKGGTGLGRAGQGAARGLVKEGGTAAKAGEEGFKSIAEAGNVAKGAAKGFSKIAAASGVGDLLEGGLDAYDLAEGKNLTGAEKAKDAIGIAGASLDMIGLALDSTGFGAVVGVPLQILGTAAIIGSDIWGFFDDKSKEKADTNKANTARQAQIDAQNKAQAVAKASRDAAVKAISTPQKSIAQSGGSVVGRVAQ